jgi:hypothetical protein
MRGSLGRRQDGEPVISWHAQNLNKRQNEPDGPAWRHGRAWLYWYGRQPELSRLTFTVEWCCRWRTWPKSGLEINQTFGDDYDLSTTFALPGIGSLYTHISGLFPRKWKADAKSFSVSLYEEYLWVEFFWTDPGMTWGKNKNRFPAFRLSFDWKSFLFGKQQYRLEQLVDWRDITIPMPEGTYPARYRIERRTWWRKRWLRKLIRVSADIDIPGGVPVPGKEEDSWNCGEDAIMKMGCSECDEASVIAAVVKSALSTRARYETVNWTPREKRR